KGGIPGATGALLGTLAGDHQRLSGEEANVVVEEAIAYLDFGDRTAPPRSQVGTDLGEFPPCIGLGTIPAHGHQSAVTARESDGGCAAVFAQHFAFQSANFPGKEDPDAQRVARGLDIGPGHWPVHELASFTTIHVMVVQFDSGAIYAQVEKVQHAGNRVFPATEEHDDPLVLIQIARGRREHLFDRMWPGLEDGLYLHDFMNDLKSEYNEPAKNANLG
ncbi:MAG: hypothetical protein KJ548_14690, partial [Actinobacteria bacterium]|nr:hypothetical protein [Actinomycetota bacterium]